MAASLPPLASTLSTLESVEFGLNFPGYVPIVGEFSGGYIRNMLGIAEMVAGIATFVFAGDSVLGTAFCVHGIVNMLRGRLEELPFIAPTILIPVDLFTGGYLAYPVIESAVMAGV